MTATPDLPAYLARIGYAGPLAPTLETLRGLAAHHPAAIPFEGLDPFLGRPVALEPAVIQAKLLHAGRGGYCQEHNSLLHDVLAMLGFRVRALAARVVWAFPGRRAPLTHRVTLVELPEGRFLADVGFGGAGPTAPLLVAHGLEQPTPHGTYRILHLEDGFALEVRAETGWEALYHVGWAPQERVDFELSNWYTATHPNSIFVRSLMACRVVGPDRHNLLNTELTTRRADGRTEKRRLANAGELRQVLEEVMGLTLPAPAEAIWARLAQTAG